MNTGAMNVIKSSNKITVIEAYIHAKEPYLIKNIIITANTGKPMINVKIKLFIISDIKVFILVLLNPYFSSITNVLYAENGIPNI